MSKKINYYFQIIWITILFSFSIQSYATLGGPEEITVLGYDQKDQKIYLLRHYVDESGRLPQLYYFQLNSKTPNKFITVSSIYPSKKLMQHDFVQAEKKFDNTLKAIGAHLKPLTPYKAPHTVKILPHSVSIKKMPSTEDPSFIYTQRNTVYTVQSIQLKSQKQTAVHYDEQLSISQSYTIPQHNKILVIVKYDGIPIETGYSIEDPVLLLS